MELQLELLALGVLLAKEFYLFLGDLVPGIFNGIRTLVLSLLQILGVSMLEFFQLSASVFITLEDDLILHLVFIRLFLKFLLLSLDSADLMEVLLLKFRAFLFGLLDHPDFCLLLAFDSDDLGLEEFLLLLDDLFMGVFQGADLTLMSFFLFPQSMLEVDSEFIQSLLHMPDSFLMLPMQSTHNFLMFGPFLCQILLILLLVLLLHTMSILLAILDILPLPLNKLLLPLAVILHILMSFTLQFLLHLPQALILLHLGQQLKLSEIFSHFL